MKLRIRLLCPSGQPITLRVDLSGNATVGLLQSEVEQALSRGDHGWGTFPGGPSLFSFSLNKKDFFSGPPEAPLAGFGVRGGDLLHAKEGHVEGSSGSSAVLGAPMDSSEAVDIRRNSTSTRHPLGEAGASGVQVMPSGEPLTRGSRTPEMVASQPATDSASTSSTQAPADPAVLPGNQSPGVSRTGLSSLSDSTRSSNTATQAEQPSATVPGPPSEPSCSGTTGSSRPSPAAESQPSTPSQEGARRTPVPPAQLPRVTVASLMACIQGAMLDLGFIPSSPLPPATLRTSASRLSALFCLPPAAHAASAHHARVEGDMDVDVEEGCRGAREGMVMAGTGRGSKEGRCTAAEPSTASSVLVTSLGDSAVLAYAWCPHCGQSSPPQPNTVSASPSAQPGSKGINKELSAYRVVLPGGPTNASASTLGSESPAQGWCSPHVVAQVKDQLVLPLAYHAYACAGRGSPPIPSLLAIPADLLSQSLFPLLPPRDLVSLGATCQPLWRAVEQAEEVWYALYINDIPEADKQGWETPPPPEPLVKGQGEREGGTCLSPGQGRGGLWKACFAAALVRKTAREERQETEEREEREERERRDRWARARWAPAGLRGMPPGNRRTPRFGPPFLQGGDYDRMPGGGFGGFPGVRGGNTGFGGGWFA